MYGHVTGYQRVSSSDQSEATQLEGVVVNKIFPDKASGRDTKRPQLQSALEFCREVDTLVIDAINRLTRNLDDLRSLVLGLTKRGIKVQFVKEGLVFTGEDSAMSNLLLSVMGAFANFERSLSKSVSGRASSLRKKPASIREEAVPHPRRGCSHPYASRGRLEEGYTCARARDLQTNARHPHKAA